MLSNVWKVVKMMPIVKVELLEGRTLAQKRLLVEKVTQAIVDSIGAPAENVTVIIRDMSKENFSKAGKLACDK
jgi:4-oxalocrotonate tautomerase